LLCLAGLLTLVAVPTAQAAGPAAAGPEVLKCTARNKAACVKQNQANRIAFGQIKDSTFVGTRGDGMAVEETYCANGRYASNVDGGISTGARWRVGDAVVKQGGKWIVAFVKGTGGYETALVKQGPQWKVGVASLGRVLDPGNVTRSDATDTCRTL